MPEGPINERILAGNTCFGCGLWNERGLRMKIYREGPGRVRGVFTAPEFGAGFPGMVQGGIVFAALDCLTAWALMPEQELLEVFPITRTARVTYVKAARVGDEIALTGEVVQQSERPPGALVRGVARNAAGEKLVEGEYEFVMLTPAKIKKLVGIDELPEHYRRHYRDP